MDQMSVVELEKSTAVPVSPTDYVYLGQTNLGEVYLDSSSDIQTYVTQLVFVFIRHNLEVF